MYIYIAYFSETAVCILPTIDHFNGETLHVHQTKPQGAYNLPTTREEIREIMED